jgi:hypothetical protein
MRTKKFGTNKVLYIVNEKSDGSIEVHVASTNKSVRKVITNHFADPVYFLQHQYEYQNSSIAAKKWIARIVSEYRGKFEAGKVSFVLGSADGET